VTNESVRSVYVCFFRDGSEADHHVDPVAAAVAPGLLGAEAHHAVAAQARHDRDPVRVVQRELELLQRLPDHVLAAHAAALLECLVHVDDRAAGGVRDHHLVRGGIEHEALVGPGHGRAARAARLAPVHDAVQGFGADQRPAQPVVHAGHGLLEAPERRIRRRSGYTDHGDRTAPRRGAQRGHELVRLARGVIECHHQRAESHRLG